mmetsp:Transcript_22139/g.33687  ORF Transcript_22139/g.33687 Transcript_22139/m.33687 type:complete len:366 (+) Transcript_22139:225-1322(+)|eukprot:CAMPEP_0194091268 /NCGR_PEP_ID=MMETSP0149-20130528/42265_1 /TAXON_ID=122233 /ORGANISM="Chaetoceros debilis, Strain MM31A-1" /LENGTH=365 /DNA_ID=CAMNT_0038775783 /DNA_START=171 /DNA_END=1268 /DNA_ORIENTATION=+
MNITNNDASEPTSALVPAPEAPVTSFPVPAIMVETVFEYWSDILLGVAFLAIGIIAARRMSWSKQHGGVETNVVTAFYSLILITAAFRSIWFLVPDSLYEPSYVPHAVFAFSTSEPWVGGFISEEMRTAGSLSLFSIFILILVYWADILKKYFQPGSRRSRPMNTFLNIVSFLILIEVINAILFLLQIYSSEGMILLNAILLSTVSIICVVEISIFSHKFRTVLQTLGAINQVSTESQVKRIVWITVTGNMFFFTRAFIEAIFAFMLIIYWQKNGNVQEVFTHPLWDTYMLLKHWSEIIILALMLYILQSRFTVAASRINDDHSESGAVSRGESAGADGGKSGAGGYQAIPEEDEEDDVKANLIV